MVALTSRESATDVLETPERTVAPWVPVAWIVLLFVSSFRFSGSRSVEAAVSGTASLENLIELAAYGLFGGLALVRLLFRTPRLEPLGVGLFAGFALLAVASVLWSVIPLFTLIRSSQLMVLAALVAATAGVWSDGGRSFERDWSRIWLTYLGVAALASGAAFIWPNWQSGRWAWPGLHTGVTSEYIAIGAMVILSMRVEKGWRIPRLLHRVLPLVFVGSLVLLLLTITRSSLFGFIAGAFLIAWTGSRIRSDKRLVVIGSLIALAVATVAWFSGELGDYLLRGQTVDQFYTFTGRTDLWSFALNELNEAALLGFGYGAARVVLIDAFWWAGTGHNLWIEAALSVGIVGAVLLTAVLVWAAARCLSLQRRAPGPASSVGIGFVAATLIGGFASTALALPGLNFATAGLVLAGISVARRPPVFETPTLAPADPPTGPRESE